MPVVRALIVALSLSSILCWSIPLGNADKPDQAPGSGSKKARAKFDLKSPLVRNFKDCVVAYVVRNAASKESDVDLVNKALETDCSKPFNAMAEAVVKTNWFRSRQNEVFGNIHRKVVAPAVRVAREKEQRRVERAKAEAKRISFEKGQAALQCLTENTRRAATETREDANTIEIAVFQICMVEVRKAAEAMYSELSAGWPELPPETQQAGVEMFIARVRETVHPRILAMVVEIRSQPTQTPAPKAVEPKGDTSGSGVAISKRFLLTNAHVVERCSKVWVEAGGSRQPSALVTSDPGQDLAVIRTSSDLAQTVTLRKSDTVLMGESVYVFGFPLTGALSSKGNFTEGSITALEGLSDDPNYFQISAPVQPGNSGGPLVDAYGQLIGIVTAKLNAVAIAGETGDIPQNVNFAIKLKAVKAFLRAHDLAFSESSLSGELPKTEIAKRAQSFTARVICER